MHGALPSPPNRRVIIQVRWGPLAYHKAILDPGQSLRVGRADRADLVLARDAQMSSLHFELSWDGERCHLHDLGSAKGTFLHGEQVDRAGIKSGDWIRAGQTDFSVYFEAHTRPNLDDEPLVSALGDEKDRALTLLRREHPTLFAVVDASRGARPLHLLRESIDPFRSLYDGVKGEALAHCAPYLVALRPDSGLLDRLVREGWRRRWAIFVSCPRPFKDVRRHLRRFLLVEDDATGKKYYFRFYDPKTLRAFVPSCAPRQREDFFGEVAAFIAEGARGEVLRFEPQRI